MCCWRATRRRRLTLYIRGDSNTIEAWTSHRGVWGRALSPRGLRRTERSPAPSLGCRSAGYPARDAGSGEGRGRSPTHTRAGAPRAARRGRADPDAHVDARAHRDPADRSRPAEDPHAGRGALAHALRPRARRAGLRRHRDAPRERHRRPPTSAVEEPRQLGGAQRRERRGQRRAGRPEVLPGDRPRHALHDTEPALGAARPARPRRRRAGGRQPARRRGLRGPRSGAARIAGGRDRGGLRPGHALPRRRGHAGSPGACGETAPSEAAALLLVDPAGRELVFRASRTIESGVIDGLRLPASRGIAGWVARNRQAVRLDDVASDPRHFAAVGEQTGLAPGP